MGLAIIRGYRLDRTSGGVSGICGRPEVEHGGWKQTLGVSNLTVNDIKRMKLITNGDSTRISTLGKCRQLGKQRLMD